MESPLNNMVNSALASPVALAAAGRAVTAAADAAGDEVAAALAATGAQDYDGVLGLRSDYPVAAVVNDGWPADGMAAACEIVAAFEPGMFVEVSERLASIKGLATGDRVRVFNDRGSVEAPVLVTARVAPFQGREGEGHYVYLNGTAARATAATDVAGAAGDGGGRETIGGHWMTLAPSVTSPVGGALDAKGFLVDIEKI